MKKGKRLLLLLTMALTLVLAFTVTSFAGYTNTDSYKQVQLGTVVLSAPDATYDGSEHGATLEDTVTGTVGGYVLNGGSASQYVDQYLPYGVVSDIEYYNASETQQEGTALGSAPVNAGFYLAKAAVTVYKYDDTKSQWDTESHYLVVFYKIRKAEVDVSWDDEELVYDGNPQFPAATAGVEGGESVQLTVKSAKPDDTCIDAGPHKAEASMPEGSTAANNYVLKKTGSTHNYSISKRPVQLTWKRPVYDEKGNPTGDFQAVDANTMIRLVYNYQRQTPVAEISNLIPNDKGKVEVILGVSNGNGEEASPGSSYYVVTATGIEGSRAENYSFENRSRRFQIIPRPVTLKWGYKPGKDAAAEYATEADPAESGYNYKTTYNGVEQTPFVEVGNIPTDEYDDDDYVRISKPKLVKSEHIDGTVIDEDRIYTDAGKYSLQPGELNDKRNYTYYTLFQDTATGEMYLNDGSKAAKEYVDDYDAVYTIEQYDVKSIVWGDTEFTYDANYHIPTAEVGDRQGPDTSDEVSPVVAASYKKTGSDPVVMGKGAWNANDDENNPKYFAKIDYEKGLTGDRAVNYKLSESAERQKEFFIHKKALTIKANNKTIVYRDAPSNAGVSYNGLINGDPNNNDKKQDGTPGTYKDEDTSNSADPDVIDGEITYTYNYAKNGKPGTYTITPDVSGLTSRNYEISAANGTLKVNDKVSVLVAKGTKKGSRGIILSWNSVSGAASYDVYMSQCNSKGKVRTPKFVKRVRGNTLTVKKLGKKKLKKKTCYKYYVVARNSSGKAIATSKLGHFITGNVKGKTTNAKSMSVNRSSVTVGEGGTAGLSASYTKAKNGKKYKLNNNAHAPLTTFISENPEVATVDANGIVKGVAPGWCRVYVQGVTGMWTTVAVNVK